MRLLAVFLAFVGVLVVAFFHNDMWQWCKAGLMEKEVNLQSSASLYPPKADGMYVDHNMFGGGRLTVYHNGQDSGMTKDEYNRWLAERNESKEQAEKQAIIIGAAIIVAGLLIGIAIFMAKRKA